ncbi:peptidase domain-containing ABC transporter [Cyanobium sp. HWJ4-Hawea]|uniref:ABC transporter transmembrane domain-containing protein n=1 Tax=Cyanobium sp. HWJ4-Hawea TaxID=2823713 RepID=UPI0020CED619|nr:ABC transporter transmembrane domain-containing protein [Cyanobium sp. HWJ4-Hawea]MCP9808186.1 peptidase domain-containing ABC transporter [Cyanobium sp. HWJ4-Hawea]
MNQQQLPKSVLENPGFAALAEPLRNELFSAIELVRFNVGDSLSLSGQIPAQLLLLLEGSARLLVNDQERWITIDRLRPGDWVGIASLLRAGGCEEVSAAESVLAAAIPDHIAIKLIANLGFWRYACGEIFPAEIACLIQTILEQNNQSGQSVVKLVERVRHRAVLIDGDLSAVDSEQHIYAASCNLLGHAYGAQLDPDLGLPIARPPLPARLIAVPAGFFTADAHGEIVKQTLSDPRLISEQPLATGLDLGVGGERQFRLIQGEGPIAETLACFQMLATELDLPFRKDSVEKVLRDVLRRGQTPDLQLCGNLAAMLGLHVSGASVDASMGTRLQTPALLPWKGGFALLRKSNAAGIELASPRDGLLQIAPAQIAEHFPDGIEFLMLERTIQTPEKRFGPSWFLPAIKRYRGVLVQVLLASFVVQLFGLAAPLLIQVIIDKVITQRSLDTLQVLGFALVVVTLMEGVLGALRTFLFTETSNRIDMRLGAEVIDHLLRLPLNYFDRRPVGELGTRIAELEKIRNFLTGQALSTVLDAALSVIYIIVMVAYSWLLTLIALGVLPIQIGLTLLGAPLFRRQYREAAQENARTQSHLVEVLTGIQTVKSQNIEMISRWKWQDFYSKYISRTYEKTITGTALTETSQVLQKLSQLLVLWVGATLVLKGEMSLGQLIAFRIISGYVTQPLLRLSGIWQNIQELKVSFERLADVVDTPQESDDNDKKKIPLPPISGAVVFDQVRFSFNTSQPPVLRDVSLEVPSGSFVGVVGQSGSGKSTLTKMLSRLYAPDRGKILIDGNDIAKVELYSLRRQIGIVPQEPLLFSGSVADNIALADPEASSDDIVFAAKLACAHDFIMEMPSGYSSDVGERGSGLSGGQRQRIALARTLLLKPRLLVLDEATSALDYDTERRVFSNLIDSLDATTVFFITHRLSTIQKSDLLVMMDQGSVVETGTHDELINLKGRYYALYRQQEAA